MRPIALVAIATLALLAVVSLATAQPGGLELSWYTIEGGGTTSASAGDLTLSGTIGQADAGTLPGGNLVLEGGFWGVSTTTSPPPSVVYLPLILR